MACRQSRRSLGVEPGSMLKIESESGTIIRRLSRLLAPLIPLSGSRTLFISEVDAKLLGVASGEAIEVQPTDETLEMP